MKHTRKKSTGTKRHMLLLPVFLVAVVALILGATAPGVWAQVEELDEFEVFIEINATDLDAGLQGKLDGEAWNWGLVKGPNRRAIFRLRPTASLRHQGVTEFAWESAEPPFEPSEDAEPGYTLDDFLARHPEGRYKAWARKLDRSWLRGVTWLTHDLPAGPQVTSHDEEDPQAWGSAFTVTWNEVTKQFDPDDPQGEDPATSDLLSEIVEYIVVVEYSGEIGGEEVEGSLTIDAIAPDVFSADIPADFLPDGTAGVDPEFEFKIEVGAKEESGNLSFTEVPLELVAP